MAITVLDSFSISCIANDDNNLNSNLHVGVFSIVSVADLNKYPSSTSLNISLDDLNENHTDSSDVLDRFF